MLKLVAYVLICKARKRCKRLYLSAFISSAYHNKMPQTAINRHLFLILLEAEGLPRWLSGKESACQCKRHGFDSWVGKSPWRRKWQHTPVLEEPGGLQFLGSQRVRHDYTHAHTHTRLRSPRSRHQQTWLPVRAFFPACTWPPPPHGFMWPVLCVLTALRSLCSFSKDI